MITGAAGNLGQRVLAALAELDRPDLQITAVDRVPVFRRLASPGSGQHGPQIRSVVADLASADLGPILRGATVLVHLAVDGSLEAFSADGDLTLVRRVLAAAGEAGVHHVVLMSSATVYGAWSDNPVPLTEDAPLRPNTGFEFAASRAELERLSMDWREEHPGTTVTLLRPAVSPSTVGVGGWLFRAVQPGIGERVTQTTPAMQFVHVDDIASAVAHVALHPLDGPVNVAPDGWIRAEDAPALLGATVSVPIPGRVGTVLTGVAGRVGHLFEGHSRPDGAEAWTRHSWVVANDRLRSTGWVPRSTSEETIVAARKPSRFAELFARRRQEVTLAAVLLATLAGLLGVSFLVRRGRRRR